MLCRSAFVLLTAGALVGGSVGLAGEKKPPQKPREVWTDPKDPTLPVDFALQGEYIGEIGGGKLGAQVIALGQGHFQAVVLPGGLPGAGWDGKRKTLLAGRLDNGAVVLKAAEGKRRYLAQKPEEFSATAKFPPAGHEPACHGLLTSDGLVLSGCTVDGKAVENAKLMKTIRTSPTLGAKPPAGAIILFDGTQTDEWRGGRLDKTTGLLNTDGSDIQSKRKFNNFTVHAEFLLPYRPEARGQGRGNSGFYMVHHYEVQILDSFGLEGKNNECSGIYSKVEPKLNMCLPPLQWQTYDIDFTNAVQEGGKKVKNARITVRLNGVVVHDDVEIKGPTGGHRNEPEGTPGPFILQGHGNPLQFRNIWVVEKS
ncbi:MAG: DUF1080 domain-containing protein [Gemmataceae bacterium]|nr:DUF1080 domain-containing protein [Gemmataceae bacterium]